MTIENIKIISSQNLSLKNEVLNIASPNGLAGISWFVVGDSMHQSLTSVLQLVYKLIEQQLGYNLWLFTGHSAQQPDTRIVRYYKLWGSLGVRGAKLAHASCLEEVMHDLNGALRFFGVARLTSLSIESVISIMREELCTYLVALPNTIEPWGTLPKSWIGDLFQDTKLLEEVVSHNGILIKEFGWLGDLEKGVTAVGDPKFICRLLD